MRRSADLLPMEEAGVFWWRPMTRHAVDYLPRPRGIINPDIVSIFDIDATSVKVAPQWP
jgi:hypothetical protein